MSPPASTHSQVRSEKEAPAQGRGSKTPLGSVALFPPRKAFFLTNQPSLLNEHCDRGKQTAHRLSSDSFKDPTQILEEHLSSLDSSQALLKPRILVRDPMEIHLLHAQSLGEVVVDGSNKPFLGLACPLNRAGVKAEKETQHHN